MRSFKIVPLVQVRSANLSKAALKRLAWFDYYHTHNTNISLTCRHFGISRDTFYLWKGKFNPYNLQSLEDNLKTRTPHHLREMTTPVSILKRIYEIRLNCPWMSKYEIEEQLKREGIKISTKPIERVIKRHPELHNTDHVRKVNKHRRYKIARIRAAYELKEKDLGSLVQIDTKYLYILGQRFFVYVAIDCKSRLGFTYPYKTCNSTNAADFLTKVINYFPFQIQAINTDNGPEYLLNFHKKCEELLIPHYFNTPHTPTMNSRAERLIQTLEYEYLHYKDDLLPEMEYVRSICNQFNDYYNKHRFHRALHYKTPQEYVTNYQNIQKGNLYVI
jgi:transposase InsO family protein